MTNSLNNLLLKIKNIRIKKGLTQADVANELHLSPDAYTKIERGVNMLSVERLFKISEIIDVGVIELLSDDYELCSSADLLNLENRRLKAEMRHVIEEIWYLRETNTKLIELLHHERDQLKFFKRSNDLNDACKA